MKQHPAKPLTPCREYQGARMKVGGYGVRNINGHTKTLHRWIVEQIEGPLQPGEVVMHLCDNPPCFRYDHLLRATQKENIRDAMAKGRHRYIPHRGEENGGGGKLTEHQARQIKFAVGYTRKQLAAYFGVSVSLVDKIRQGLLWGWVK